MSQHIDDATWWQLHLRKARGESLSEQDEKLYVAEIDRQDQEAPQFVSDLASLRTMRAEVLALTGENQSLGQRTTELQEEIRSIEASLSRATRQALGIAE